MKEKGVKNKYADRFLDSFLAMPTGPNRNWCAAKGWFLSHLNIRSGLGEEGGNPRSGSVWVGGLLRLPDGFGHCFPSSRFFCRLFCLGHFAGAKGATAESREQGSQVRERGQQVKQSWQRMCSRANQKWPGGQKRPEVARTSFWKLLEAIRTSFWKLLEVIGNFLGPEEIARWQPITGWHMVDSDWKRPIATWRILTLNRFPLHLQAWQLQRQAIQVVDSASLPSSPA